MTHTSFNMLSVLGLGVKEVDFVNNVTVINVFNKIGYIITRIEDP